MTKTLAEKIKEGMFAATCSCDKPWCMLCFWRKEGKKRIDKYCREHTEQLRRELGGHISLVDWIERIWKEELNDTKKRNL